MPQLRATVFTLWPDLLIAAALVGIGLHITRANSIAVFVVNFIAIIYLAAMLTYATEQIALRVGDTNGELLCALFGNVVELIIAIIALAKQAS